MANETKLTLKKLYKIFDEIKFDECCGCKSICCNSCWFLKEEQEINKKIAAKRGEKPVTFFENLKRCKYAKNDQCQIYNVRPLDCRLFPLDLIRSDGAYWWVIFTNCPQWKNISKKVIPLIPRIESLFTDGIFKQYQRQIAIMADIFEPSLKEQYKIISKYKNK